MPFGLQWKDETSRSSKVHIGVCPKRPFACKYCEFKARYEQVCNDHYSKCTKYPVPCPNKCEIGTVERGNLQKHMSECPGPPGGGM